MDRDRKWCAVMGVNNHSRIKSKKQKAKIISNEKKKKKKKKRPTHKVWNNEIDIVVTTTMDKSRHFFCASAQSVGLEKKKKITGHEKDSTPAKVSAFAPWKTSTFRWEKRERKKTIPLVVVVAGSMTLSITTERCVMTWACMCLYKNEIPRGPAWEKSQGASKAAKILNSFFLPHQRRGRANPD